MPLVRCEYCRMEFDTQKRIHWNKNYRRKIIYFCGYEHLEEWDKGEQNRDNVERICGRVRASLYHQE